MHPRTGAHAQRSVRAWERVSLHLYMHTAPGGMSQGIGGLCLTPCMLG